jgi:hypothetical protein
MITMAPSLVAMLLGLQSAFSATTNGPVAVPLRESAGAPVFTRAEMEADLEHLTVRLKRAWAYAEDKHAWLGVDIDSLHAAARRELDDVHDADEFYFLVKRYVGGLMDGPAGVRCYKDQAFARLLVRYGTASSLTWKPISGLGSGGGGAMSWQMRRKPL